MLSRLDDHFMAKTYQAKAVFCKAICGVVFAVFAAAVSNQPAQAQYYFERDLHTYWGPYPPRPYDYYYGEPADEGFEPRPYYRHFPRVRRPVSHHAVSEGGIRRDLSAHGLHLIAPIRRKGGNFLVAASDAKGQRQRLVFSATTGRLIDHAWLGPKLKQPEAPKPPLEKSQVEKSQAKPERPGTVPKPPQPPKQPGPSPEPSEGPSSKPPEPAVPNSSPGEGSKPSTERL
jgi:hypothetical protein